MQKKADGIICLNAQNKTLILSRHSFIIIAIIVVLVGAYLKLPSVKESRSERAIARHLSSAFASSGGRVLKYVYIPKSGGGTAEIDVVCITTKGIIVVENKNYAGYIFGNENNKNWTVTLYAGRGALGGKRVRKIQFYNPVWQNKTHISDLKAYLNTGTRFISLVAFSDRGSLKDVTVNQQNAIVCNHAQLNYILRSMKDFYPDVLNQTQIDSIYSRLSGRTNVSAAEKQQHIAEAQTAAAGIRKCIVSRPAVHKDNTIVIPIKQQNNVSASVPDTAETTVNVLEKQELSTTQTPDDICPLCGGKLVLRTAKKGTNAGKQFYGCSNYPKCRYTKNL